MRGLPLDLVTQACLFQFSETKKKISIYPVSSWCSTCAWIQRKKKIQWYIIIYISFTNNTLPTKIWQFLKKKEKAKRKAPYEHKRTNGEFCHLVVIKWNATNGGLKCFQASLYPLLITFLPFLFFKFNIIHPRESDQFMNPSESLGAHHYWMTSFS